MFGGWTKDLRIYFCHIGLPFGATLGVIMMEHQVENQMEDEMETAI